MTDALLSARLTVSYSGKAPVLRNVCLDISPCEVLGLAGGSGSGKSTLALALMKLHDKRAQVSGRVMLNGRDLLTLREAELRDVRGREVALVLQSPAAALNSMLRIGTHLREAWRAHQPKIDGTRAIAEALESVSLPSDAQFLKRFPSEISTGQGQRVLIAMAILHRPNLLIADEPTSALDAITQAEVLDLLRDLNRKFGTAVLLISHDLGALASVCDRIAILHEGEIVEYGEVREVFRNPSHEYTKRLTSNAAFAAARR